MPEKPSRRLILPPSDRAYWTAPLDPSASLLYLGWGGRQFGSSPIPAQKHDGWVYVVVESGRPFLVRDGKRERVATSELIIIGPDCAFGWDDDPRHTSKLLFWMWRRPVYGSMAQLSRTVYVKHRLRPDEMLELHHLHALCRTEILLGDTHSEAALSALQGLLETRIVRVGKGGTNDPRREMLGRALLWLEAHLSTRQPLARLADYLGVSVATVQRLFREQLGIAVRDKIAEMRRLEAQRMLQRPGMTIKEVAYSLGYRHPHDFSRAFRKNTGSLPSRPRQSSDH